MGGSKLGGSISALTKMFLKPPFQVFQTVPKFDRKREIFSIFNWLIINAMQVFYS